MNYNSQAVFKGGYQAYFFGNINFEIEVAQQGPYMYQHFGEVSGPRRPTGSEQRPALIWAPGIAIYGYFDPRWSYGAPNCSFNHPESPHIGFGGSRMKTVAARAINVYSRRVGTAQLQPLYGSGSHKY